jgi:PAS domain S-box-containing protein
METIIHHLENMTDADFSKISPLLKERALESTTEGVVIADCTQPGMPIIYVNSGFTVMTGYLPEEVLGHNCRFLQGTDSDPQAKETIRAALAQNQPCTVEILNYRKDGTPFWNRLSITPVRDETGRTTHFIGIQTDVTVRRRAEDSLRAANEQLEQANETLRRDLTAAAAIQQTLLPGELPQAEGFRFAWRFRPCRELAGDTLNITPLDKRHVGIYVLDVSGHGAASALQSFSLSQTLGRRREYSFLYRPGATGGRYRICPPQEVLRRLNRTFPMDMQTGMYFTMLYGVLDLQSGVFTFASAGHPGPVLARRGQPPQVVQVEGFPIGVTETAEYRSQKVQLQAGDKLILYTDGVVEALSSRDLPFGQDRFLRTITKTDNESLEACLDVVMTTLEHWSCHVNLRDDVSLVGVEAV